MIICYLRINASRDGHCFIIMFFQCSDVKFFEKRKKQNLIYDSCAPRTDPVTFSSTETKPRIFIILDMFLKEVQIVVGSCQMNAVCYCKWRLFIFITDQRRFQIKCQGMYEQAPFLLVVLIAKGFNHGVCISAVYSTNFLKKSDKNLCDPFWSKLLAFCLEYSRMSVWKSKFQIDSLTNSDHVQGRSGLSEMSNNVPSMNKMIQQWISIV